MRTKKEKLYYSKLSFNADGSFDIFDEEVDCAQRLEGCGIALDDFTPVRSLPLSLSNEAQTGSDFYEADFRMLSACIVGANSFKASDFSDENLLRGSMSLIDNLPICTDHHISADNIRGYVSSTRWEKESMSFSGDKIPSGIVGRFMIDKSLDGSNNLVKNLESGALNSDSVTIYFGWKPSHKMKKEDFYNSLGSIKEGSMVRRIATKITGYAEVSLVVCPADKFARRTKTLSMSAIDNTKINEGENENKFALSCEIEKGVLSLSKTFSILNKEEKEKVMNKKLEKAIRERLGLAADVEITNAHAEQFTQLVENKFAEVDSFSAAFTALGVASTDAFEGRQVVETAAFAALETRATEAEANIVSLNTEVETLKPMATLGTKFLTDKREGAVLSYQKACVLGNKTPSPKLIEMMNLSSDPDAIDALQDLHVKSAVEALTATCKGCGGREISFRSSTMSVDNEPIQKERVKALTVSDIRNNAKKKPLFGK